MLYHLLVHGYLNFRLTADVIDWDVVFQEGLDIAFLQHPMDINDETPWNAIRAKKLNKSTELWLRIFHFSLCEDSSFLKKQLFGDARVSMSKARYFEIAPSCHLRGKWLDPIKPNEEQLQ